MFAVPAVYVVQELMEYPASSNICLIDIYLDVSVPNIHSASVHNSTVHFQAVVAATDFWITKFVPSYISSIIHNAGISQLLGSFHALVFILFAHNVFALIVQAHVFTVVALKVIFIHAT